MKHFFLVLALGSGPVLNLLDLWFELPGLPLGGSPANQLGILVATGLFLDKIWGYLQPFSKLGAWLSLWLHLRSGRKIVWVETLSYSGPDRRRRMSDRRGSGLGGRRCTDLNGRPPAETPPASRQIPSP